MRFGLRLIEYLGDSHELLRLAQLAEAAGFDSVWFPHDPFMRNTWVLTTGAAMTTSRIQIGSVGTNPYTTCPSEVATYAATLDELSGGRFILGLGLHSRKMVAWTGWDASDVEQSTREATDIIRRLLRGEVVAYDGERFTWSEQCHLRFSPLREDLPIYVSAFGDSYLALGGEIGDGCLPMVTPPESADLVVASIRRGMEANPRKDDFVISGCCWLSLSETREAAAADMRKMVAYFGPHFPDRELATIGLATEDFRSIARLVDEGRYDDASAQVTDDMLRLGITGTPDEVIEQVGLLADAGIDEVNLGGPLGPDPEGAIRLMGERVIPQFRSG